MDDSPKKTPKTPTHVRDAEGVGRLFGVEFYSQRKQRMAQLESVRAAMSETDFPAKIKSRGWPRAEVLLWAAKRIELSKGKRDFKLTAVSHQLSAISQPEIPPQDKPAAPGEMFPEISATELRKGRFDRLQDMYLHPEKYETKIAQWEREELKQERPYIFAKETEPDGSSVNIEGGMRGVAGWICNNYQGRLTRLPRHTDIVNWSRGEYLPAGCRENFPASEANNSRYKTALVTAWVEKYIVKADAGQVLPMDIDYRVAQEKLDYERSQAEYEVWKQENSDKYILRETAEASVVGALKLHHAMTKRHCEKLLRARVIEKISTLNHQLSTEILTAIGETCAAVGKEIISAIEADCERA